MSVSMRTVCGGIQAKKVENLDAHAIAANTKAMRKNLRLDISDCDGAIPSPYDKAKVCLWQARARPAGTFAWLLFWVIVVVVCACVCVFGVLLGDLSLRFWVRMCAFSGLCNVEVYRNEVFLNGTLCTVGRVVA